MDVHLVAWIGLIAIVIALITVDIVGHVRTPHAPTLKEAGLWTAGYVTLAISFGFVVWALWGLKFAGEYWAGWITEWSLSLDNLFVFVIIIAAFRVPREYQQKVLLSGIIIALVLRFVFILIGATLIEQFSWIFYIFGLWLIWTAISQVREATNHNQHDEEYEEPLFVRFTRRFFPVTDGFLSDKLLHRHAGKTYLTPMLLVIIAVGSADLMFAFDSIPAIFGLTNEPYLVFAANAFALLGLRQLYFLIDGLLERLVYLHWGLAAILGFIGVKLILHAMHENNLSFVNGGQPFHVPEVGIPASLAFIVATLTLTIVASIWKSNSVASKTAD
ncbi:integral membrane protein, TerC family [Gleimia coleocanis DSM 15436]|uniref:Integral membrane protein, TerC family n=1 Tax=Gleimia coleocanis DSM 15436 TaxID=525245 RepID=C0W1F0_9ACTO|nr:TerC family protein [Gleimia coleocanis]EEH63316.1 integral membrane protein, TerC family [Gleimia coleocanis DSM 15436]